MVASSWRKLPTAPFRGLASVLSPDAASLSLRASNCDLVRYASPRTSIEDGASSRCRGMERIVLTFCVTSSPNAAVATRRGADQDALS